ncbi:hypothetical protein H4R35_003793 [Dimargaris xerosporica]|nr:hypothetical protein H4R35_003793 [Dimargaris xerosporica]
MPTPPDQASDPDDIQAPLVFQCATCAAIVGDSFAWVAALEELDCVVLSGCSGEYIAVDQPTQELLHWDRPPPQLTRVLMLDAPTANSPVPNAPVHSASPTSPPLPNGTLLDVGKVTTYELGRAKAPEPAPRSCTQLMDFYSTASVTRSITQMKKMLCVFNDRLERIEKQLE